MDNNYVLTVIIPVYNTDKYIERCINSVVNQSLKNIKIVAIDDASTDMSWDILRKYAEVDNILVTRNNNNIGQGATRNLGLKYVNTKYFCFLDSDDWVDINAYKRAINSLESHGECDIAVFGIKTEYDNYSLSNVRYQYEDNIVSGEFALSLLTHENAQESYISALLGNKVFRSHSLSHFSFSQRLFEDISYTYKVLLASQSISLIENEYLHYYQRPRSIMHSFSIDYIDDLINEFLDLKNYLEEFNSLNLQQYYSLFEKCCTSMFNTLFMTEQDAAQQKKYMKHFVNSVFNKMNISEMIDYLDINRIKMLLYL